MLVKNKIESPPPPSRRVLIAADKQPGDTECRVKGNPRKVSAAPTARTESFCKLSRCLFTGKAINTKKHDEMVQS